MSNKGVIKLSAEIVERMQSYRQQKREDLESGGVLLGRFLLDSKDIVVDKITVPMFGDKRARNSFHRGEKMHQRAIDRAWEQSRGTCHYLGEWHTHPDRYAEPSRKDIANWERHLKRDIFSSRFLYFVIVGTRDIGIWEGDRRNLRITKLKIYE